MAHVVAIPGWIAEYYNLPKPEFTRCHMHLCERCDLFFQYVVRTFTTAAGPRPHQTAFLRENEYNLDREHLSPGPSSVVLPGSDGTYPHWSSFEEFQDAVAKGCHTCRLVHSQLSNDDLSLLDTAEGRQLLRYGSIAIVDFCGENEPNYYLSIKYAVSENQRHGDSSTIAQWRALRAKTPDLFDILELVPAAKLSGFPTAAFQCSSQTYHGDSEKYDFRAAARLASSWISNCLAHHQRCNPTGPVDDHRPERLIWLGTKDDFSDLRLQLRASFDVAARYVTLSHPWGSSGLPEKAKLFPEQEASLCEHIPFESLPETFQDAIRFARSLSDFGVRYIWIDSLCIMQGQDEVSHMDWVREGSRMDDIYTGSLCTLAAGTGPNDNYGLFPSCDEFYKHVCSVTFGPASALQGTYAIRNYKFVCDVIHSGLITRRAWCFQELWLPSRLLCFAPGRLLWRCRELQDEDRGSGGGLYGLEPSSLSPDLNNAALSDERFENSTTRPLREVHDQWGSVLHWISKCELRYPSDRPLVVSGVAKRLSRAFAGRIPYAIGFWRDSRLCCQLLWAAYSHVQVYHRPLQYVAPSWSWLSSDVPVEYTATKVDDILVELDMDVHFENNDPFGIPIRGRHGERSLLRVRGPVVRTRLTGERSGVNFGDRLLQHTVDLKVRGLAALQTARLDFHLPGSDEVDVHCLLMGHVTNKAGHPRTAGLLLIRQDDMKTPGRYIRIGVFDSLPEDIDIVSRSTPLDSEAEYEQELPDGTYQISIV